ncbi:histidine phosphotransferase, partial [Fomes fomentarius]
VIDLETFNQILDLDEDDTHDFSLGMAEAYFSQASTTFTDMEDAFAAKDLPKLSSLGHFLKGSSAALGVSAVQATCEHIQHYGALRDEANGKDLTSADALAKIAPLLKRVKREYAIAERWLQQWYKEHVTPAEV